MATYSANLALTLMATGEQSNTWGDTTNTNLGTLLEQAISGYVTQAITDGADTTITIPNGTTGVARNMFLELTGALTATRNLIVPTNKKLYFVHNNTTGGFAVTVKVSGLTGVSVPNGRKVILVSNGTDIVEAHNAISGNATVGGTLGVTGTSTLAALSATTGTFSSTLGVTGVATLGNGAVLGTPASGTVTNLTGTASININGTVGATTATTGAFTTVSASGAITSTKTSGAFLSAPSGATNLLYVNIGNTSGTALIGVDSSVGGTWTGSSAYSTLLGTDQNKDVHIGVNSVVKVTVNSFGMNGILGATTAAAATVTTLSASGTITSTVGNNGTIFSASTATTGYVLSDVKNTGGRYQFGVDSSTGGQLATGSTAYATVLTTVGTTPIQLAINGVIIESITSTGVAVTGTLSATTTVAGSGGASTLSVPTRQVFLSGTAATYTTPANCRRIVVRIKGGGGGSHGSSNDSSGGNPGNGGTTTFNSINANGGGGGPFGQGGQVANSQGGKNGTGTASLRIAGAAGHGPRVCFASGTTGFIGGGGGGTGGAFGIDNPGYATMAGQTGEPNTGGGGSGAGLVPVTSSNAYGLWPSSGGGEGEYAEITISSPAGTYTYTVGAGGTAGTVGTGGYVGGAGGSGFIYVDEYY